ncbi:MAG TPA: DinB family protein [Thermomicrobiales bacterium]|nr:DinB family protein [Thermomicrobiales bacterium]
MDLLERMLGHDYWATGLVLNHAQALTPEQLQQEFDIGLGSVQLTLTHQVNVIHFWSEAMLGRLIRQDKRERKPIPDLIRLHDRYPPIFGAIALLMQADSRLDEQFTDVHGNQQSMGGTILQLMGHNTQHRSEVRHMLVRLGVRDVWDGDPQEWEHDIRKQFA